MTTLALTTHILSAIVLMGVCCRLFDLHQSRDGWQSRVTWNLWVSAHVLIFLGMVARLFGIETWAPLLLTSGLALMFGVRWRRRVGDK